MQCMGYMYKIGSDGFYDGLKIFEVQYRFKYGIKYTSIYV
jgi:hypothetical protein